MNVFDYLFSCFSFIINVLNHDFFGFGFSYLDFVLAASLAFIILKFLLQGFNEQDRFNFLSLSGAAKDFNREYQMKNNEREKQLVTMFVTDDINNGSRTVSKQTKFYNKDNDLVGVHTIRGSYNRILKLKEK